MLRLLPEYWSLSTTENYDATGTKAKPSGLTSYKKSQFDLTAVYGWSPDLSVFARLSFASVSFKSTFNGAGSGLTEQGLGLNYRLWNGAGGGRAKTIDAQFSVDIPIYDNVSARSATPRQPILGDGSLDVTGAAFGTFPLNQGAGTRLYAIGGLGLVMRTNNYSKAVPYQLQLVGIPEQSGFTYRFGFHGFKSLASDPNAITALSPQGQISTGVVDPQDAGRSLIVDALNSSYLTLRGTLGYQWGQGDQIYLTAVRPLSGTSTAAINGIILGAQLRFGTPKASTVSSGAATTGKPRLSYDLEGRVKQANDRLNLIKIDRGEVDGVAKGQVFDIYRPRNDGRAGDLVARGVVTSVSASEAVVNLRQYKKEVWVQSGFVARRIKKTP